MVLDALVVEALVVGVAAVVAAVVPAELPINLISLIPLVFISSCLVFSFFLFLLFLFLFLLLFLFFTYKIRRTVGAVEGEYMVKMGPLSVWPFHIV